MQEKKVNSYLSVMDTSTRQKVSKEMGRVDIKWPFGSIIHLTSIDYTLLLSSHEIFMEKDGIRHPRIPLNKFAGMASGCPVPSDHYAIKLEMNDSETAGN